MEHKVPLKHTPSAPGVGSKVKSFLLKVVMLHSKLMGLEHIALCKHILCPYTHPNPWVGPKGQSIFFNESSDVAYQIDMEHRTSFKHIVPPYTHPQPPGGNKRSKLFLLKVALMHIKL